MKRVLIAIAIVGILAPTAWVVDANAQQMSPGPAPSQAYGRSQMAPTQAYAQRRVRRSARRAPAAAAPGGLTYTPGSGPPPYDVQRSAQANAPYEWHAAPGPNRRGNMCVTHTDPLRGYGYQAPCKK